LRAVLAEADAVRTDAIVVLGEVVGGPMVREALELLDERSGPTYWIRGNGEREAVAACEGAGAADGPAGRATSWSATQIDRHWRDRPASWPIHLSLDGMCF
jgi:hypothetical protein